MRIFKWLTGSALALALCMALPAPAQASDVRIWVDLGDVLFIAGQPHHRMNRQPLHILPGRHGPRYYYNRPLRTGIVAPYGPHYRHGPNVIIHHDVRYPPRHKQRRGYTRHRRGY